MLHVDTFTTHQWHCLPGSVPAETLRWGKPDPHRWCKPPASVYAVPQGGEGGGHTLHTQCTHCCRCLWDTELELRVCVRVFGRAGPDRARPGRAAGLYRFVCCAQGFALLLLPPPLLLLPLLLHPARPTTGEVQQGGCTQPRGLLACQAGGVGSVQAVWLGEGSFAPARSPCPPNHGPTGQTA